MVDMAWLYALAPLTISCIYAVRANFELLIMAITRSGSARSARSTSREQRAKREDRKHTAGESLLVERRLIVNGEERGRKGRLSARLTARTPPRSLCKWTCGLWGVLLLG